MFKRLFGNGEKDKKESTPPKQFRGGQNNEEAEESKSNDPSSPTDEPMSHNDYFIVKNPLVLLICCSEYPGKWNELPGVETDHNTLRNLFHDFCGFKVESICGKLSYESIRDFLDVHKAPLLAKCLV